jgi:hypothetical protein
MMTKHGAKPGDIMIGNLDLDEIFARRTVMRLKYCTMPEQKQKWRFLSVHVVHFRFDVNCWFESAVTRMKAVVRIEDDYHWSLAKARMYTENRQLLSTNVSSLRDELVALNRNGLLVWHYSTFGSIREIQFKMANSAHAVARKVPLATLLEDIELCRGHGRVRKRVADVFPDMLPIFVQRNLCWFSELGWIRSVAKTAIFTQHQT